MIGQIVAKFRLWLVLALCFGLVVIDSVSRIVSMTADLGLVAVLLLVLLPALERKEPPEEKQ